MATLESPGSASPIDVVEFIDQHPVGGFQIKLLLICAAVLFLDGFDTQAIGYVAPALAKEWGLSKAALGPVFSAGLFGLMIGALLFGPLADRIGRKKIIIFSTIAFGVGTLIAAFVNDVNTLIAVRLFTGLGLGGAMPNAVALTSEFSPHRRRATMVMAMFCGFVVGAATGGLLAAALIPAFGWRAVFVVGGVMPLLLVLCLAVWLPESVRFLALSGRASDGVAALLARIAPSVRHPTGTRFVVQEIKLPGIPVVHLLSGGRAWASLFLWVLFFMSLLDLHMSLQARMHTHHKICLVPVASMYQDQLPCQAIAVLLRLCLRCDRKQTQRNVKLGPDSKRRDKPLASDLLVALMGMIWELLNRQLHLICLRCPLVGGRSFPLLGCLRLITGNALNLGR